MYRFGVDADTSSAEQKLNRIKELMDEIDRLNSKTGDNYFYSSQKDIDRNVKSMQEIIKLQKDLERQMSALKSTMAEMGDIGGIRSIDAGLNALNKTLDTTKNKFQETADSRQRISGHDRELIKDQERFNMELSDEIQKLKEIKDLNREIRGTQRRVSNRAQNFSSAGRMTANQERVLKGDMEALRGSEGLKERNDQRIKGANSQIDSLDNQLRELAKNTSMNNQERRNEEANLKRLRKATEEYIKALQEANTTIKQSAEVREQAQNRLEGTTVDADPNTWKGQLASRAPSIAIALLGSFAGVFGSLYARGGTANSAMREPSIHIGQRTGQSDFRAVRKQAQEMGLDGGTNFKGLDMLGFEDSVLSSQGFTDKDSLAEATQAMAEGARAIPVDKEQIGSLMESVMRDGAVAGSGQIEGLQEAILGAIEQSGMVGREKEQISALENISKGLFSGRNGNKEELDNVIALQGMLSEKGGRALQGEKGGELLTSLDAGFKNAVNDPITKLIYGRGTKYQGYAGQWELEKDLEAGLGNPDNLRTTMKFAEQQVGGANASQEAKMWAFKRTASERLGVQVTADQVEGMYNATNNGADLTDEVMEKLAKEFADGGSDIRDKNLEDYKNSREGLADRSEAVTEKQASYLNDKGDILREINSGLGGLPAPLYALTGAVVSATGALLMSGGMGGISTLIKNFTKSKVGAGTGAVTAGTGFFKQAGNVFKSGKASGGFFGGAKQAGGFIKDSAMFKGSEIAGKAKGLFQGGASTASAVGESAGVAGKAGSMASKGMGFLGKAGGVLGKVAPWLAVGSSVVDIATSEDKVKATGKNGGMLAGMWAGAKGGTALGAMSGNPLIAGLGGLAGGIGGAFVGSKLGEGAIDIGRNITGAIKDGFSWGKDKVVDGIKGAFSLGKDFFSKGMDILKTPDRLLKKGASKLWDIGKGAVGKVGDFFGGETAEASEIQQSGLSAGSEKSKKKKALDKKEKQGKNSEEKDTTDKKLEAEKAREKNVMNEGANLSMFSTLLDRAKQLLATSRAQNGTFGTIGGSGDSLDISGGTPEYSDWEDAVKKASGQLGVNASDAEIQKVLKLIQTESGGKEVIQNDWDVNAQNGNPSKGLLQYIQTTFDAYAVKGHGDINSGYDQLLAFFNNSNWQKDLEAWEKRMASGSTGWGPTGSARYAMGGKVTSPTNALIGEVSGQPEYVINPKQPTAPNLLAQAMRDTQQYFSMGNTDNGDLLTAMSGSSSKGGGNQTFSTTNDISVTVTVDGSNSSNFKQIGDRVGESVKSALADTVSFYAKELRRV